MLRPSLSAANRVVDRVRAPRAGIATGNGAPVCRLQFALPHPARITVDVMDSACRVVRTVFQGDAPAGEQACCWDGRDAVGGRVASGIYTLRLEAGGRLLTSRVVEIP